MSETPIGGQETLDARAAVDEMVAAWQLHDSARGVPGAAINAPSTVAHYATAFTHEQAVTALAYVTRTIAQLRDAGDELDPCDSEIHSWTRFHPDAVDPYWIRCTRLGPHEQHEDSNTGAKWTNEDAA